MLKVYGACNQRTAIQFIDEVLRRLPFRVHLVQTDNGAEFQSQFHWHPESRDIRHVYIRPRTPHLNGKGRALAHWTDKRDKDKTDNCERGEWRTFVGASSLQYRRSLSVEPVIFIGCEPQTETVHVCLHL